MDKNQILDQLKQINYPGFNRDIVSFGMVKEVVIDQKKYYHYACYFIFK